MNRLGLVSPVSPGRLSGFESEDSTHDDVRRPRRRGPDSERRPGPARRACRPGRPAAATVTGVPGPGVVATGPDRPGRGTDTVEPAPGRRSPGRESPGRGGTSGAAALTESR